MPQALSTVTVEVLTREEARTLTDKIKRQTDQVWSLLLEAHERKAWKSLGYSSWRDYAKTEFDMSQTRAYQLLDQARVNSALQSASGFSTNVEIVNESTARRMKPHINRVTGEIAERIEQGADPSEAITRTVNEWRDPLETSHRRIGDVSDREAASAVALKQIRKLFRQLTTKDRRFLKEWINAR